MEIVVISLNRAQERRKIMIEQLEKLLTYHWHILKAIDSGELSGKEHIFPIENPDGSFVGQPIDL